MHILFPIANKIVEIIVLFLNIFKLEKGFTKFIFSKRFLKVKLQKDGVL